MHTSPPSSQHLISARAMATALLLSVVFVCSALAQQPVTTSRNDNTRSGANTNEVLLAPANVNKSNFGHLFSFPVDYQVLAQPLYVPNVNINGAGTLYNVVYVATQMNSVYAIDADTGAQLWYASMNDGGVPASGHYLPCGDGGGFLQEGIIGTPVIDLTTTPDPTMYLVAKTVINGTVEHNLHALDITTGLDEVPPVLIQASSVSISNPNTPVKFNSLHQKNRPGLLLLNGTLYLGFGSNSCNDSNSGWVLAYDANTSDPTYMQQLGAFNTSPNIGLTSIWQTGNGLAGDDEGNVYVSTAESANYGNQSFSNSILKLTPPPWNPQSNPNEPDQFFTPSDVMYLNSNDLDISSVGPLILPDQDNGPAGCSQSPCHEVVTSGKQGIVYVLDRDNMGGYDQGLNGSDNVLQEFPLIVGGLLMCSPAYWNGTVYFGPDGAPLQAFQVTGDSNPGPLIPFAQTTARYVGAHSPSISANGNSNGILWVLSGNNLDAFDAVSMGLLYSSSQSGTRDKFPKLAHFSTQTVADGRVYVGTGSSLEAFGLFHILSIVGGNNQTAQVLTQLPLPIQITATNPYTGQPDQGVTVTFSDGNKGGTFGSPTAVTDVNGSASTTYTFGKSAGVYTITVSAPNYGSITTAETATPAAAQKLIAIGGGDQTAAAGSVLPNPIQVRALDAYKNAVPGVTVNFASAKGGSANPPSVVTNSAGAASTSFTLPTSVGKVTLVASSPGLAKPLNFPETSVAGPAASVTVTGGNNQAAPAGTTLPQALTVVVADQYGNPVSGASVTFSDGGAGGTFNNPNPATTNSSGVATQSYTLPAVQGPVTITATVTGVSNPAVFNETAQ